MAKYVIEDTTLTGIADAIRAKTGSTDPVSVTDMATQISAITGGGSAEGVVYVTFVNGDVELCKTACMTGDSTVDPVEDGKIAVPTKEPTEDTVYTFSGGWALTDGGEADELALIDVTEDRTVYAAYTESTRLYTVNFYDDDGETLLESQQVAYGGMPSPATPEKADYSFLGWEPELAVVTGDTDYASVWTSAAITFADSSLDTISAVCEAGNAESYFAVGDTRTFTGADGNEYTMRIIGLNVDPKEDGSGYAGITFAIVDAAKGSAYTSANWDTGFNTFVSTKLPDDLSAVLKSVNKKTYYKSSSSGTGSYGLSVYNGITTWQPSYLECGMLLNNMNATQEGLKVAAYPGLATQEARAALGTSFWTRTTENSGSGNYRDYFTASGYSNWSPTTNTITTVSYIVCGCI